jgi:hypothetical protein
MLAQTLLALGLTLVSASLVNWAYITEHAAASALPRLSARAPLRSLRLLFASRRWVVGLGSETAGFALYVVAVALAPLALVQAVAAGGIGVLAFLVARTTRTGLARRERFGVIVAIGGLALLGISLAGGSDHGVTAGLIPIALWLSASAAIAAVAVTSGATVLRDGAAFGVAAGILFAGGDVSTKVMVDDSGYPGVALAVIGFYAAGTIVLQMGFQQGRPLTTAGIATLGTNAIPIAAAMTLFAEPLPDGPLGVVRVGAFAAVVAGAVALAPRRTGEARQTSRPKWGLDPIAQNQAASKSGGRHESKLDRTQATA